MNRLLKNSVKIFLIMFMVAGFCSSAEADSLLGAEWTQFQVDDNGGNGEDWVRSSDGYVGPGWGGQAFDAEYLSYQLNGNILSIGLQTGFDLEDGAQQYNGSGMEYYSGDLALSFDGDSGSYEYAVDFGLLTKDYYGTDLGTDTAGLYAVDTWNIGVYSGFGVSNPFAMQSGTLITDALTENTWSGWSNNSNYRTVSFDITNIPGIVPGGIFTVDAHWTMSCGNDAINGSFTESAPVPEPSTLLLLSSGLMGLAIYSRKRRA